MATANNIVMVPTGAAQGDIAYFDGTRWTRLARPSAVSALKHAGAASNPAWDTPSGILDNFASVQGSILVRDAANWAALAPGTSGYYLKAQGAGANPIWTAFPAAGKLTLVATADTGGAVSVVSFTGLSGNSVRAYLLTYQVMATSAGDQINLRPNDTAPGAGFSTEAHYAGTSHANYRDTDSWRIAEWTAATAQLGGFVLVFPIAGPQRTMVGMTEAHNPSVSADMFSFGGFWTDTSTEITSLYLRTDSGAARIASGSKFALYRIDP